MMKAMLLERIASVASCDQPLRAADVPIPEPAGGRLVINAIRKEDADKSALSDLSYHEHLWMEREIKSVANITRRDIAEFLPLAAKVPLRTEVSVYPLERANEALVSLKRESVRGAKVLRIG